MLLTCCENVRSLALIEAFILDIVQQTTVFFTEKTKTLIKDKQSRK